MIVLSQEIGMVMEVSLLVSSASVQIHNNSYYVT